MSLNGAAGRNREVRTLMQQHAPSRTANAPGFNHVNHGPHLGCAGSALNQMDAASQWSGSDQGQSK